MKKQILVLLLTVLTLFFSGCISKRADGRGYNLPKLPRFAMPDIDIPAFNEKTLDPSIATVQNLKVKTSDSQVALEWEPRTDNNIGGYRIFRGDGRGHYALIATLSDRFRSHYVDRNTQGIVDYRVSLFTKDGKVSPAASIKKMKRARVRLTQPIFVEVISNLPKRIKLLWKPSSNPRVKSYIIERKQKLQRRTGWTKIAKLNSRLSAEFIDKDVEPGKQYYYRIRSVTYEGSQSVSSKVLTGQAKNKPKSISSVIATDDRVKEIQVAWTDPNNEKEIHHYNIYSSQLKDTLYTFLKSSKTKHFTDKFDTDGVTRYYRITAVDLDGLESDHTQIEALGKTIAAAKGPKIESATVSDTAIHLRWSDPDRRARKFTIIKKYWDGWISEKRKIEEHKSFTYVDRDVKPDTKYTYYIYSIDKDGVESLPSKEVTLSIYPK
jgi:fibronectin type 3 domain-containing protein